MMNLFQLYIIILCMNAKSFGWLFTFEGNFNHQYIEIDKNIQIKLLQKN